MPGFLKSKSDEKLWNEAKSIARKRGIEGDRVYTYANALFERMARQDANVALEESTIEKIGNKLDLYSQVDYSVNNLDDEEMWYAVEHALFNHGGFNKELDEATQYKVLSNLYSGYKESINKNDFQAITEYVDSLVVPSAKMMHEDTEIVYGLNEYTTGGDYVSFSGGYGYGTGSGMSGMGGYGGRSDLGSVGMGSSRSGGIRRDGGQMNRRYTGNPNAIRHDKVNDEPIVVDIPDKKSNYNPDAVELSPDGIPVKDIERAATSRKASEAWDNEIGAALRGLEQTGLDLADLAEKTPEEIEDILVRKFKILGNSMDDQTLTESVASAGSITDKILEVFGSTTELEEKVERTSRIQDARDILQKKHQQSSVQDKNEDRSYVVDQYGIEKLMRKFGYEYDFKARKWIKKSGDQPDMSGGEAETGHAVDDYEKEDDVRIDDEHIDGPDVVDDEINDDEEEKAQEEPEPEDYEDFKVIDDPVTLENTMRRQQARFILSVLHNDLQYTTFNVTKDGQMIPDTPDKKVDEKMKERGLVWDSFKDIWVDDTNTIPAEIFEIGETRQSLLARSYLAAMGNFFAVQFDNSHNPLITPDEANSKLGHKHYKWDDQENKWLLDDKDLANTEGQLNESYLLTEADKPSFTRPVKLGVQKEAQARFLYRLEQFKFLNEAPEEYKKYIKDIISSAGSNPLSFNKGIKPAPDALSYDKILKLLTGNAKVDPSAKIIPDDVAERAAQHQELKNKALAADETQVAPGNSDETQVAPGNSDETQVAHGNSDEDVTIKGEKLKEADDDGIELRGDETEKSTTTDDSDGITLQGDKAPGHGDAANTMVPQGIVNTQGNNPPHAQDPSTYNVNLTDTKNIIPNTTYTWDKDRSVWLEGNDFPVVAEKVGEDIKSLTGRTILASDSNNPRYLSITDDGEPQVPAADIIEELEDEDDYNWTEEYGWIKGELPEEDPDELNPLEERLRDRHVELLQSYELINANTVDKSISRDGKRKNKGSYSYRLNEPLVFDGKNMNVAKQKVLIDAVVAQHLMDTNHKLTEKVWFRYPENDPDGQKKEDARRANAINDFKKQYSVNINELDEDDQKPGQTHKIDFKKKKSLTLQARQKLSNVLTGLAFAGAGVGANLLKKGFIIASAMDGYNGPYASPLGRTFTQQDLTLGDTFRSAVNSYKLGSKVSDKASNVLTKGPGKVRDVIRNKRSNQTVK